MRDRLFSAKEDAAYNAIAGTISGLGSNLATHPVRRAIYLAVDNKSPFFRAINFDRPFKGLKTMLVVGTALNTEYLLLQNFTQEHLNPCLMQQLNCTQPLAQFISGALAGSFHGQMTNTTMSVQRYSFINKKYLLVGAKDMFIEGGLKAFVRGAGAGMLSGALFSAIYQPVRAAIRHGLDEQQVVVDNRGNALVANVTGALIGGAVIAPLSYAREIQQAGRVTTSTVSMKDVLVNLTKEILSKESLVSKFGVYSSRVHPGLRAFQIAFGLGIGQTLFDQAKDILTDRKYNITDGDLPSGEDLNLYESDQFNRV